MNRTEIDKHLAALERNIAGMLVDYPDHDDFMHAFAGEADGLEDGAVTAEDSRYTRQRHNKKGCGSPQPFFLGLT